MIAVVLAAGRGTRLAGEAAPKPLVPVAGVPAIDRILGTLARDGFDDVVVVTGHRASEVEAHLAHRSVRFAGQEDPSGTADALRSARDEVGDGSFLVTWSDVIVEPGTYRRIEEGVADADGAVAINALDDLSTGGAVTVDAGFVSTITEKPGRVGGWNHTGISVFGPGIWAPLAGVRRSARGEYELTDAVNAWIEAGARLRAVPLEAPVFEIGTPEGLAAASAHWAGETRSR
jgi:glucose-1-phosphate thymidylyltransferase